MEETSMILAKNNKPDKLEEFEKIMREVNVNLNKRAKDTPDLFRRNAGKGMEVEVFNTIKSEAVASSFRDEDIVLKSGQSFPDIIAAYFTAPNKDSFYYGVEVKTTKEDKWKSIGSSIVESTRIPNVERIFLMFGKLGKKVEFKCRPYEECMSGIAVTHSPRYTIDMNLNDDENIFRKLNTTYDAFREDADQIKKLRSYYLKEARDNKRNEMPWWMGDNQGVGVTLYSDLSIGDKNRIKLYLLILFESVLQRNYKESALWMCTRLNILIPNARDLFTAGGKCVEVDNKRVGTPFPHIVKNVLESAPLIKKLLDNPDEFIIGEIEQYWDERIIDYSNLFEQWISRTERIFKQCDDLKCVPIGDYIKNGSRVTKLVKKK